MRDATGHTRHRRISCATSSGQRTTCSMREALHSTTSAQHGTDVHRRHTQDATYGRCRSMQQTHTEATTRSMQSNARDERGDKWKPDARAPRGCVGLAAPAMVEWRLDYRSSRLPLPCLVLPAVPECFPRELLASHDSTAMSLPSTASSSASEASRNASNRAAPSVSSSAPSVSEAEWSGAARGVDCFPTADEMTRQLSGRGSKLRCWMGETEGKMRNVVAAGVPFVRSSQGRTHIGGEL